MDCSMPSEYPQNNHIATLRDTMKDRKRKFLLLKKRLMYLNKNSRILLLCIFLLKNKFGELQFIAVLLLIRDIVWVEGSSL